jgi:tyrosyl-tRNA synthetase
MMYHQVAADQALNEAQMAEQIRDLAHGENVEEWSKAIAQYLRQIHSTIRLPDLQQALEMRIVELWLGLLIGGYFLEPIRKPKL